MRTHTVDITVRRDSRTPFVWRRIVTALAMALLILFTSPPPAKANIFGDLGNLYGCVVTWGLVCNMSHTVIGTGPAQSTPPIPVTCAQPLLNGLPQFLTWPKGKAIYRFQGTCSSPAKPGAVMTVRWEGSWNPSETKTDRPNASETLEITGFEPFLADRAPGGKIFMYWTARCRNDPWLRAQPSGKAGSGRIGGLSNVSPLQSTEGLRIQSGGCTPFGAYVPDDLREALPDIDKQKFPRTDTILSAADKQRLSAEYERVNPSYFQQMGIEPRPLSNALQAPIPPSSGIVPKPSAQLKIFSRGTEMAESTQLLAQWEQAPSANVAPSSVASLREGMDDSLALPPVAITFDQPLHFISTKGEDTLLSAGIYEIEPVLDLQLSLVREGQEAVLLPAEQGTHSETIAHGVALLISGESNDVRYLVFLTPDGKRFDAVGSTSGVRSRGPEMAMVLPDRKLKDALLQASQISGPPPPCLRSTLPVGPRWLPIPCTMPTMPGIPTAPVPYVDGSNMLHACLNNNTGVFRVVRSADACVELYGEVKVKWQLAP